MTNEFKIKLQSLNKFLLLFSLIILLSVSNAFAVDLEIPQDAIVDFKMPDREKIIADKLSQDLVNIHSDSIAAMRSSRLEFDRMLARDRAIQSNQTDKLNESYNKLINDINKKFNDNNQTAMNAADRVKNTNDVRAKTLAKYKTRYDERKDKFNDEYELIKAAMKAEYDSNKERLDAIDVSAKVQINAENLSVPSAMKESAANFIVTHDGNKIIFESLDSLRDKNVKEAKLLANKKATASGLAASYQ